MQGRVTAYPRVVISTHTFFYGASEALRDYLIKKKIPFLVYIGHPLLDEKRVYTYEQYESGRKKRRERGNVGFAGGPLSFIRDAIKTFVIVVRLSKEPTVFIGVNPLNACTGILLRMIGSVDRVIFYAIDFTPQRSPHAFINGVYHILERIAVRFSDLCWDVSPRMVEGRKGFLGIMPQKGKHIVVPIGIWKKDIVTRARKQTRNSIIFAGHLLEKQGLQEVLRALPKVLRRIPDASLTVIGGGEYEHELRKLAGALMLDGHVTFLGWQEDQRLIRTYLKQSDIAVATYDPSGEGTTNFSYYADPTKIKTYLSCGIPVIMTDVPYNASELAKRGAAAVVPYTSSAIARAIISWLTHPDLLYKRKRSAILVIKEYSWERIFDNAFTHI